MGDRRRRRSILWMEDEKDVECINVNKPGKYRDDLGGQSNNGYCDEMVLRLIVIGD
jgi:hypothetical protein